VSWRFAALFAELVWRLRSAGNYNSLDAAKSLRYHDEHQTTLEEQSEMGKLTAKARKKIPAKEFGEPAKHTYPMPDKAHAANAKARATQMVKKGKLSESEKKKIDAKANKKLGEKSK
jgi:hypothetical protein